MSGVILPIQFFMYGGFSSSLTIYCFGAIFLCALHSNKAIRIILVLFAIAAFETTFILSWFHPEWIAPVDPQTSFIDFCATFLLLSVGLAGTTSYLLSLYSENQKNKDILLNKLKYLAEKDPLTDLYNRRHFISYLTDTIWPRRENFFVFMYDIDNFKKINDTFGHPFGDEVLRKVSEVSHKVESVENGECAVRYGGEEFIHLIHAKSIEEAFAKAEAIREGVHAIFFEDKPEMKISISGGLADCTSKKFTNQNQVLSGVDALLYKAKSLGKNQTCLE